MTMPSTPAGWDLTNEVPEEWQGIERFYTIEWQSAHLLIMPSWARWAVLRMIPDVATAFLLTQRGAEPLPFDNPGVARYTVVSVYFPTRIFLGCQMSSVVVFNPSQAVEDVDKLRFTIELLAEGPTKLEFP